MNLTQLRQCSRQIWESALHAANPATCIDNTLEVHGNVLSVRGKELPIAGKLIVIGAGKAASRMAQVVEEKLGDRITGGLVVTKYAHGLPLRRIRQVEAGHPIPDAMGVAAVREMRELLRGLKSEDIVLCLLSGGGSALWPAPAEGITLEQKQEVTSLLLRAGATILELNAVRKHLSAIKGGQLAAWAAPARVISLIMSDVIGDPLDFIASGPTAPDTTSFPEALSIIQKYGVDVPPAVVERLQAGARGQIPDTPKPGDPVFRNVENLIIANNRLLVDAAPDELFVRVPSWRNAIEGKLGLYRTLAPLSSFGLLAFTPGSIPNRGMPDDVLAQYRAIAVSTDYFQTGVAENEAFESNLTEVRNANVSLRDMPLILISRGYWDAMPGFSEIENQQAWQAWNEMQSEMLSLSSNSRQIVAIESEHNIQLQQPKLIVDAILELIEATQE